MGGNDLVGIRFGRWTVVARVASGSQGARYTCRCDCGGQHDVFASQLRRGKSKSCGCLKAEAAVPGGTRAPEYGCLDSAGAEVERLKAIIRDLLWAIGHDNEQELNSATLRAKAALETKP